MDKVINKKKFGIKKLVQLSVLAIISTSLIFAYMTGNSESSIKLKRERLKIYKVKEGNFSEYISIRGNVLPANTIYLDAVEGGNVEEIYVEDGEMIDSGDAILRLDNANLLMDIMNREAEFYEQQNNLRNTRLSLEQNKLKLKNDLIEFSYQLENNRRIFERNKKLFVKNHISEEEYLASQNNYDYMLNKLNITLESQKMDSLFRISQINQLEASLNRMENNLAFVKTKLEKLVVKAPISGQLSSLNAEIGQSKAQGSRLGQIDVISEFKIQAGVDEYYIGKIKIGQQGKFKVGDSTYIAVVNKIYPQVAGGTFNVDFKIDKDISGIRRGQTIMIDLELSDSDIALLVERNGFYNETGGNWIFKVEGNEAYKVDISLGRQNPKYFEIKDGLKTGDQVIVSSYTNYKEYEILKLR